MNRRQRIAGRILSFAVATLLAGWIGLSIPGPGALRASSSTPNVPSDRTALPVRPIRVLLDSRLTHATLKCDRRVTISDDAGSGFALVEPNVAWTVSVSPTGSILFDEVSLDRADVTLRAEGQGIFLVAPLNSDGDPGVQTVRDERSYVGDIRLVADANRQTFTAINAVDIESYVESVVAWEAWPTFHAQTCRAQAVAARTYVLDIMGRRNDAEYDVVAGQGAQVYGGLRSGRIGSQAREATDATAGIVLTVPLGGRLFLFRAYYSAVCGGGTQSSRLFGDTEPVAPLRGGVSCSHCEIAPEGSFRWKPVTLTLREIHNRIRERFPDIAPEHRLVDVSIAERDSTGNVLVLQLRDSQGGITQIGGDRFRVAVGADTIRSCWYNLSTQHNQVRFEDGRGFGHAVGLCQWGSEGLARAGRSAAQILAFYYPGSRLVRAY